MLGKAGIMLGQKTVFTNLYNYIRVFIYSNSQSLNLLFMNEMHMQGSIGGADVAPTSISAKDYYNSTFTYENLIDYNSSTSWLTVYPCAWPEWVTFYWSTPQYIAQISMTANGGDAGGYLQCERMPRDFDIQGSNNNVDWITLRSYTGVTFTDNETKTFAV
jgi:hypothetical protein